MGTGGAEENRADSHPCPQSTETKQGHPGSVEQSERTEPQGTAFPFTLLRTEGDKTNEKAREGNQMKEKQNGRRLENLLFLLFLPIPQGTLHSRGGGKGKGAPEAEGEERRVKGKYCTFICLLSFARLSEHPNHQFWEGQHIVQSHREAEAGTGFCQLRAIRGFQVPSDAPSPHSFFFFLEKGK